MEIINDKCENGCNMADMPGNSEREKLMREIMNYDFVETELVLYLDTHPHDMKALEMHAAIAQRVLDLYEEYEKK